jgi:spore coat protein CotF
MVNRNRNTTNSRNRLSDRDMLFDMLATGKLMSHLYDHAILESSNNMVRDTFETLQHSEHQIAQTVSGIMQQEGWYNTGASRQNSNQLMGKPERQGNFNIQANSQYATTSGAQNFGSNMGGRGQNFTAGRAQAQTGYNPRPDWS